RLRVEVAAHIHRQRVGISPRPRHEHGAHLVDTHAEPRSLAPLLEQRPPLGVVVGQRLPVRPTRNPRPDLRQLVDAVPQPIRVDTQVLAGCWHSLLGPSYDEPLATVWWGEGLAGFVTSGSGS